MTDCYFLIVSGSVSQTPPTHHTRSVPDPLVSVQEESGSSVEIDPPTAAGNSSTLSESQYTHVHNLIQCYSSIQELLTWLG